MSSIDKIFLDADSNDEFIRQLMSSVVLATKASNTIPQGSDFQYHNMDPDFRKASEEVSSTTKGLIRQLCGYVNPDAETSMPDDLSQAALYEQVVDVIDTLLEGADKFLGGGPKASKLPSTVNQTLLLDKNRVMRQNIKELRKPQLDFFTEIDNRRNTPFKPRLTTKYHATISPLDLKPLRVEADGELETGPDMFFAHPYEAELRALSIPSWCTNNSDVLRVNPMPTYSQDPVTWVDNDVVFEQMLSSLRGKSELAIDLEHHSHFTFQGLTCVMQISSREHDFVVDTLAMRLRMPELGEFLADPSVVKVLHGCDKDILWLQRDLGLYLVNCFDTHVAAKALSYPALSLAHLLKMHCGVNADKKHQLSDWRVRPLPAEMLHYAKEDTHYLLYVYDRLRQELWKKLGKPGLEQVFNASRQLCIVRYEKPLFNPLGYRVLFKETSSGRSIPKLEDLTTLQDAALAGLWDWRDREAREHDDGHAALMSNAELVRIGVHLPQTAVQLEQLCGPLSPYTRKHTAEVLHIVTDATTVGPTSLITSAGVSASTGISEAYSSPSAKRSKAATSGKATQEAEVWRQAESVYTFTPAVLSPKATTGRLSSSDLQSPVMKTEEIFKQAGWSTPQYKADLELISSSPLLFESSKYQHVSEDNRARMQRSREELNKVYAGTDFMSRLSKLASSEDKTNNKSNKNTGESNDLVREKNGDNGNTTVDVGGMPMEIPKSFEEVYQLSQRNRQRNRDKRRALGAGAGGGQGEEEDIEGGGGGMDVEGDNDDFFGQNEKDEQLLSSDKKSKTSTSVDPNFYFNTEQTIDNSIDGTLEFAQSIGWVKDPSDAAAIRDAHLQDLSFQQAATEFGTGGSTAGDDELSAGVRSGASDQDRSNGGGSALRRSGEKKSGSSAATHSSAGNKGSNGPTSASWRGSNEGIATGRTAKVPTSKGFDYSKVPHAAVGALPGNASTAANSKDEMGGGKGKGKGKGRNSDTGSYNPYLLGSNINK